MRAISNRLLLSAASIPPAVPSGISSSFSIAGVFVCVWADVLVFRSRDELARNREYDGDDDYYCCCCFGCCGGFVSTTPSPTASSSSFTTATSITRCYWDDGACCGDDAVDSRGVSSAAANAGAGRVKAFM